MQLAACLGFFPSATFDDDVCTSMATELLFIAAIRLVVPPILMRSERLALERAVHVTMATNHPRGASTRTAPRHSTRCTCRCARRGDERRAREDGSEKFAR